MVISALLLQQLLVGTLLDDLAVGQQNDVVRMLDGTQPVGNDQHGADVLHLLQRILNQKLGFCVDIGGGLVQDHDAGLVDDGTGEAQQLTLTGGEIVAPLPDGLVQTLLQLVDEVIRVHVAAGFHNGLVGDALLPQEDIAADIAGEQEHILQHLTEVLSQGSDLDLFDVDAVNEDLTLLDIVVAADQAENGGLAGAGGTHKGHGLLGLHMEGNTLQHPFIGLVGEPDILEFDLAPDFFQLDGIGLIHHVGDDVQNAEDLLRACEGLLQHIKLLRQGLDGVEEPGDVHVEGNQNGTVDDLTQELRLLNVALGAEVEQAQLAGHEEHVNHGAEDTEYVHPVLLCLLQTGAALDEILQLPILLVEDLGDLHAGEIFGQVGVDVRGGIADAAVNPAGELPEDQGEQHHEGHEAQHHQGQRPVQQQHGHQHTHDDHGVLHQSHQNVGKHEGNPVGVVGDTGHQLAHGDVVQLFMAQLFNVGEHVQTDPGQDLLTNLLEGHGLQIGADQTDHQNTCVDAHHGKQVGKLELVLDGGLNVTHQQGGDQIIDDGKEHDEEHTHKALPVGLGIAQQPADDLLIGELPLPVVARFLMPAQGDPGQNEGDGKGANDGCHDDHRQKFHNKLMHCDRLPLLPASGGLPFSGRPGRFRTVRHACRRPPDGRPR